MQDPKSGVCTPMGNAGMVQVGGVVFISKAVSGMYRRR